MKGIICVLISWAIAFSCDIFLGIKAPQIYWLLGVLVYVVSVFFKEDYL